MNFCKIGAWFTLFPVGLVVVPPLLQPARTSVLLKIDNRVFFMMRPFVYLKYFLQTLLSIQAYDLVYSSFGITVIINK